MAEMHVLRSHMDLTGGSPEFPIDCEMLTPVPYDFDLIPLVGADGNMQASILPRTVGQHGVWGCAVCEQWHPLEVKRCPLAGPFRYVCMGPFQKDDEEPFYLLGKATQAGQKEAGE